jgi:hypothetical protein
MQQLQKIHAEQMNTQTKVTPQTNAVQSTQNNASANGFFTPSTQTSTERGAGVQQQNVNGAHSPHAQVQSGGGGGGVGSGVQANTPIRAERRVSVTPNDIVQMELTACAGSANRQTLYKLAKYYVAGMWARACVCVCVCVCVCSCV